MSHKKNEFQPPWSDEAPEAGSYRSVFKWGDPKGFKHPNRKLYRYMKDQFNLTDDDFRVRVKEGREKVSVPTQPPLLDKKHREALAAVVGSENVADDDYSRVFYSTGKTQEEAFELRDGVVKKLADLIVHPRDTEDVAAVVRYCDQHRIPLYVYGGGSSVNFGFRPMFGGVMLVLNTHMNKLLEVNELNKTATVQAGMFGPAYEEGLNHASEKFGTKHNYTNGHFPQSFEYSSVGGWVVTLGSGQESSYYGDAYDLVMGVEMVSPRGVIETHVYPATATGPKVLDMIKGSEGTFGVITKLTMKIFYLSDETKYGASYVFKDWETAVTVCREISQGEFGFPGVLRISDEEETDMGLRLYGVAGTPLDTLMRLFGFKEMKRCLMLVRTCGEKHFSKNVLKQVKKICRRHGGLPLTSYPVKKWDHGRYLDPYLREDLNDFGMVLDTTECGVTWDNLHKVHQEVRRFVKSRPLTGCLAHSSHFYPEGTNLYFIFFCKVKNREDYIELQSGIFEAIQRAGGSLSHHHGVGRMIAPWMEEHLGKNELDVLKTLKNHFDPNGIMNPGGQMGLDYRPGDLKGRDWRGIAPQS